MLGTLSKNWWLPLLRGIFAIIFGLIAIFSPGAALTALVLVFGAYALIDGGISIYQGITDGEQHTNRAWTIFEGIIGVIAGLVAFFMPLFAGLTIVLLIGAWAFLTGIIEIVAAIRLRREIENEIFLGLAGLLSIVFGILIFFFPLRGALAVTWIIGIYAVVFGLLMIGFALRLRGMKNDEGFETFFDHPAEGRA